MTSRRVKLSIFVAAAIVTSLFFINFCNLVFQCGCRSLWAGADTHCNVHQPAMRHCPWCTVGMTGAMAVYLTILAAQAGFAFGWRGKSVAARALMTAGAFPVVGGVIALLMGWIQGYWV